MNIKTNVNEWAAKGKTITVSTSDNAFQTVGKINGIEEWGFYIETNPGSFRAVEYTRIQSISAE